MFSVNLEGPLRTSQCVAPTMRDQGGGSIVNIGTMAAYSGGAEHLRLRGRRRPRSLNLTKSMAHGVGAVERPGEHALAGPVHERDDGRRRADLARASSTSSPAARSRSGSPIRSEIVGPVCLPRERRVVVRHRRRPLGVRRDAEVGDAPLTIIDVDAHFEPVGRIGSTSFPALKAEAARAVARRRPALSDEQRRDVRLLRVRRPAAQRAARAAHADRAAHHAGDAVMFRPGPPRRSAATGVRPVPEPMTDPSARVAWMDERGIASQHVITGAGVHPRARHRRPRARPRALEAVNTWMTDAAAAAPRPAASGDVVCASTTSTGSSPRSTRMRERGSRAFLVSAEPVGGIPPMHPDFDKVWAAATDLGMIAHLHVGINPVVLPPRVGEHRQPRDHPSDLAAEPHQTAQVFLTAMVFDGVFERHPKLTVLMSELGIDWLPAWRTCRRDGVARSEPARRRRVHAGRSAREYVRRNVRHLADPGAARVAGRDARALPEVAVFSSDYPHYEGNPDPSSTTTRNSRRSTTPRATGSSAATSPTSYALHGRPADEGPR